MKNADQSFSQLRNLWFTRSGILLLIGLGLTLLYNMPGSAGVFAWFMPVPFLIYVSLYSGIKKHLLLLLTLMAGFILMLAKASSDPFMLSIPFSIMMGIVIGLRYFLSFLIWSYIRRWTGSLISIIAFPAILITLEYIQAFHLPFGDWGSLANTQLYNLPLLQTASLFGFLGVSALMAWAAVLLSSLALDGNISKKGMHISIFLIVFIGLIVYGDLRLSKVPEGKFVSVAAIMVENQYSGSMPSPDDPILIQTNRELIRRTRLAAQSGASIAVWGEGSTLVSEQGEKQFLDRLSAVARMHNITIVAAYAVLPPDDEKGELFQNKFTWIQNDGKIAETYLKHHPVPGEGSQQGKAPLKVVHSDLGNLAGAICYDYDFPKMALSHSRLGADLVVVPGMDWRGMLKRHTLMARIRAIEGGFALLRSANQATSMGFDNYGHIMASMPDFGNNDKVLLASLPVKQTKTLYSRIGNVLAYLAIATLLFSIVVAVQNYRRHKHK